MNATLRLFAVLAIVAAAFAPAAALAQQQTGGVIFEIVDTEGNPVSGVAVTMDSPNLPGFQFRETDTAGRARFLLLPPGNYQAEFIAEGYITIRQDLVIRLGTTPVSRVVMTSGALEEEVTVLGASPIDTTQTQSQATYTTEVLENMQLGSGARSYQSVLQQTAGVGGGGNPSVRGATLGENRYLLDGVDSTDPVTGTFGLNLIFDSIEQIEFTTGGFRAENGLASGGIVNVVTKTGGNDFEGTFDLRYADNGMTEESPHFDNNLGAKDRRIELTLGGPVREDKLWYFLAYQDLAAITSPANTSYSRAFTSEYRLAKLTWQVNPDHRISFQLTEDPADIENANAGPLVAPEAARFQEQGADFLKTTYWGRISDHWSMTAQLGFYESELNSFPQHPSDEPALIDRSNGSISRNYTNAQFSERNRDQFSWDLEYISDPTAGGHWHDIKFGMEIQDTDFAFETYTPTGRTESIDSDFSGPDRIVRIDEDILAEPSSDEGRITSVFIQDSWHPNRRTTVDFGLRWDRARFKNDTGVNIASMDLLQPRIGVAFDIQGDGEHVLRFSAGRFMHPGILTIPNAVNERANGTLVSLAEDYTAYLFREAEFDCDGDGDGLEMDLNCQFLLGGPSGSKISDSGLDATYVDEVTLGYAHAIRQDMTIGGQFVYRSTEDIIEDVFDEPADQYVVQNVPELGREYRGVEFNFAWQTRRLNVFANYTYSSSKGNVEYTQHLGVDWDFPSHRTNRWGHLSDDRPHVLKVNGWVNLPRNWQLGWDALWSSGEARNAIRPTAPYGDEFRQPRGAFRLPTVADIDIEARKTWHVTDRFEVTLLGTVTNLLHEGSATGVNEYTTFDVDDATGEPIPPTYTAYQAPREYEVGIRLKF